MNKHLISTLLASFILSGCTHYESQKTVESTTVVRHEPAVVERPAQPQMIDSIIIDIRDAPNPGAEAAAMNRLHQWLVDHQLTFQVSVSDSGGRAVPAAVSANYPVNVGVSIYQQQQPYRDFRFTPRDNRNLTILGVQ